MRLLPFILLSACGYHSRFELSYSGDQRGDLFTREDGEGWAIVSHTPEDRVDFEAMALGVLDLHWSEGEPLSGVDVVHVQAWIDTEGALAEECPLLDLLDLTLCQPSERDAQASLEREVGTSSFNTWTLTMEDPV